MKNSQRFIRKPHCHIILATLFLGIGISSAFATETNSNVLNDISESVQQQKKTTVSGLLTDEEGAPVIGATIREKGTNNGVITDIDGRYKIVVPSNAILQYSYIGCNSEEKAVKNTSTINIRMLSSSIGLEDVVVIGYGQQKKESVVSSINSVSSKELSMPTRSLANNIAGRIAGVLAIQRSGEPGKDDAQFWIRGVSSFAGGTNPLVLVDGVPRDMSNIGVDEIETFTVLKDAAATAVYGAEGANGVVLITSKRGAVQKATLDVRAEYGMAAPTRMPKLMNSYDYASLYNEAKWETEGNPTSGFTPQYSDKVLDMYRTGADPDLYPNTDFSNLLNDQTFNQRVTLNLRGGTDRVRYFISGAFYHENGIYNSTPSEQYDANIGLSRYNIRSNIDLDVTKTTQLSVDISGQYTDSHYPASSTEWIWNNLFYFSPNQFPLVFSDGTISEFEGYNIESGNPYNMINESGYRKNSEALLQTKLTLDQKLDFITKGLSLKLSGSFDSNYESSTRRTKTPTSYRLRLNDQGEREYVQVNAGAPDLSDPINNGTGGEKRIYLEASLNYKQRFNDLHDVSGMVLYMQKERTKQGSGLSFKKQSVVARASYGFDGRYMLEGSLGMTGSENFAKGYRFGIFPAVGVAWYVSNEKFMKGVEDVVNKLKVRASFGITGNDQTDPDPDKNRFLYRPTLNVDAPGYNLGFNAGVGQAGPTNSLGGIIEALFESPFLTWETEEKKNIGFDVGLFRNKIDLSVDFFDNNRESILMQRKVVSQVAGFRQAPWQNYGKVNNKGMDASIVINQDIKKVHLSFRGNFTYAKNKVTDYDEIEPQYGYQKYTGNSLGKPMLYIAEGLYSENDFNVTVDPADGSKIFKLKDGIPVPTGKISPGDIKYSDLNEDGKIDGYDATYDHKFKSQDPGIVYGFGLNAEYKGFYAGIFFQGVANSSININTLRNFVPFTQGLLGPVRQVATSHWSSNNPDNTNVMFPRLHTESFDHNRMSSTWWYRDGGFIRLKNIEFGYAFDKDFLSKLAVKKARVYVQGNNLAVWDNIKMWDPELGADGAQKYPINMTWTIGVEIGF